MARNDSKAKKVTKDVTTGVIAGYMAANPDSPFDYSRNMIFTNPLAFATAEMSKEHYTKQFEKWAGGADLSAPGIGEETEDIYTPQPDLSAEPVKVERSKSLIERAKALFKKAEDIEAQAGEDGAQYE